MIAFVWMLLTLANCGRSGPTEALLAPVPADLLVCFDGGVPAPPEGPMTNSEVLSLIAGLKLSETEKALCGKRLIAFYERQL